MSVVLELAISRDSFKLGRILPNHDAVEYSLEALVPIGESPVPFIRVHDGKVDSLVYDVTEHPAVRNMTLHTITSGDEIYSLEWDADADDFFQTVSECRGHVLSGESVHDNWHFRLEFPDRDAISLFDQTLRDREIQETVLSVSDSESSESRSAVSLTEAQHEALIVAYRAGYYDIPRKTTTAEVAEILGISDQAVSERLRRGIARMILDYFTIEGE